MRDARKLAGQLRHAARGRGAQAKPAAARRLERAIARAETLCGQIRKRLAGEPITRQPGRGEAAARDGRRSRSSA